MDCKVCDFRLVSTYIPFIVTIVRGQMFTTFSYAVRHEISPHIYCAILLNLTYFDALLHLEVNTSKISGHLMAMCFAWLTRKSSDSTVTMPYAYEFRVVTGVMWLFWVHMLMATYTFRRRLYFSAIAVTVVNSALVLVHVCVSEYHESILDINVRCLAFYVLCFVHFHVFQTRSQWDSKTHACVGPHVAMQMLYVDGYFMLASMCLTTFMCVHVYFQHQAHARPQSLPESSDRIVDSELGGESMSELVAQLRATKASSLHVEA